jgi:hypothetical protein
MTRRLNAFIVALILALVCIALPRQAAAMDDCDWLWTQLNSALSDQLGYGEILDDLAGVMSSPEYDPYGADAWVEPFYYQIADDYAFAAAYVGTVNEWIKDAKCR